MTGASVRHGSAATALPLALLIALALALTPALAGPASAAVANTLPEVGTTTYTVDPAAGAVHVVILLKATNTKPSTSSFIYFYDAIGIGIQQEASRLRVADATGTLSFTKKAEPARSIKGEHFLPDTFLSIKLRTPIFYKQSVNLRVTFDMVGAPRSTSQVRVGPAFATFPVWGYGDNGHATVKVVLPAGYVADVLGSMLQTTTSSGTSILSATLADVEFDWSVIVAPREAGYSGTPLTLAGGPQLVIQPIPGDDAWATAAHDALEANLADLQALTGLPWSTSSPFTVRETFIPGFETVPANPGGTIAHYGLLVADHPGQVNLPEDLDGLGILSGAASYWFNRSLFTDRWIDVGLAHALAADVMVANGSKITPPAKPTTAEASANPLSEWGDPTYVPGDLLAEIRAAAALESYRTRAAWYVAQELAAGVGPDKLRAILAAALNGDTPYVGAGPAEHISGTASWQRFLDLLQEVGGSTTAEELLKDFVLTPAQVTLLPARAAARDAYHQLVTAGKGWVPPPAVRGPLAAWKFQDATARIADAKAFLDLRATVEAAAAALGLSPGPALKNAYEGATDNFDAATKLANDELVALKAISAARASLDAERDLVTTVGLIGADPEVPFAAAKAAYAADDLTVTLSDTAAAAAIVTGAADTGRQRLLLGGGAVVLLVLLLGLTFVVRRRRRRRGLLAAAALQAAPGEWPPPESASPSSMAEAPAEPSTLAADPTPEPTVSSDAGPPTDGGEAAGEATPGAT